MQWLGLLRPDLQHSVKELARCLAAPTLADWGHLRKVLRFLAGTRGDVLTLRLDPAASQEELVVYADSNWGGGSDRRSTSAAAIYLRGVLLQSFSRTQSVLAQSSCEAELLAANSAVAEGKFVQNVLADLGQPVRLVVMTDSSSSQAAMHRLGVGRMRHLEVRHLWLQAETAARRVEVRHVASADNVADVGTKHLGVPRLWALRARLGLGPADVTDGLDGMVVDAGINMLQPMPELTCLNCSRAMTISLDDDGVVRWCCSRCGSQLFWGDFMARQQGSTQATTSTPSSTTAAETSAAVGGAAAAAARADDDGDDVPDRPAPRHPRRPRSRPHSPTCSLRAGRL